MHLRTIKNSTNESEADLVQNKLIKTEKRMIILSNNHSICRSGQIITFITIIWKYREFSKDDRDNLPS